MSTTPVSNPKGARQPKPGADPATWAADYLGTTVGLKVVVATTGLALTGFVLFHMLGNLKLFGGREAINAYAHFLKHSLGPFLWIARGGLLTLFVAHVALTLWLKWKTAAARPVPYAAHRVAQASLASRTMLWTGLVTGAFVAFHLAHYTFGVVKPATFSGPVTAADPGSPRGVRVVPKDTPVPYLDLREEVSGGEPRHDVYNMTIAGFRRTWVAVTYILCQLLLAAHLSHGLQSTVQTLGLKGTRFAPVWVWAGTLTGGAVLVGNVGIVAAVWAGYLEPAYAG